MKTTKATATKSETSVTLDLFEGRRLSAAAKEQVREQVGQYLVEQTLADIASAKSPVAGEGSFPALKKGPYREKKLEELGTAKADQQFSGETLDEFDFKSTSNGIKIGVFGDRAPVFDGHNNLSGKSSLPRRRSLPDEGQKYRPEIEKEINRIIADVAREDLGISREELAGVSTRRGLVSLLRSKFGDLSMTELALAVFRSPELVEMLRRRDLLRLLR